MTWEYKNLHFYNLESKLMFTPGQIVLVLNEYAREIQNLNALVKRLDGAKVRDEEDAKHFQNIQRHVAALIEENDQLREGIKKVMFEEGNHSVEFPYLWEEKLNALLGERGKMKVAKYRKKSIVVTAYRTDRPMTIKTLEGDMKADAGDWIITGVKGEQYPCKPEIFEVTYEPVAEHGK